MAKFRPTRALRGAQGRNHVQPPPRRSLRGVLRRQPGFALFVVLTLAIGIGANTAVFTVVNGVLLKPLPFPDSDRLVSVIGRFDPGSGFNFPEFPLSPPEFLDYRSESKAMEDVAAYGRRSINVGGPGRNPNASSRPPRARTLFRSFGSTHSSVEPSTPRTTRPTAPTAVLWSGYWQSRFAGDRGVVGRSVPMNGVPTTVIGVMPDGFTYPERRRGSGCRSGSTRRSRGTASPTAPGRSPVSRPACRSRARAPRCRP